MSCSSCGAESIWAKGLCHACYNKTPEARATMKASRQRRLRKDAEFRKKSLQKLQEHKDKKRLEALDKHEDDLKDDPDKLSKEFILKLSER